MSFLTVTIEPFMTRLLKIHLRPKMIRISKYFMVNVIFFSLVVCLYSYGAAEANSSGTDLHIEKGQISAELTNAPVLVLVRQIESQGGIWFKTLADLAGEKVSVRFADIPLDEGLKRILRGMNHSLVYDADGSEDKGVASSFFTLCQE